MSLVNANLAAPINAAIAANVLSDGSIAYAGAEQYAPISQGIGAPPVPPRRSAERVGRRRLGRR